MTIVAFLCYQIHCFLNLTDIMPDFITHTDNNTNTYCHTCHARLFCVVH